MANDDNIGGEAGKAKETILALAEQLQKIKPAIKSINLDVTSMVSGFNQVSKSFKISTDLASSMQSAFNQNKFLVASINTQLKQTNATQDQIVAASERINNINRNATDLAEQMQTATQDLYKLEVARSTNLTGTYASQATEYRLMVDKGLLTEEQYTNYVKTLQNQQQREKLLKEEVSLQEEIAASILEVRDEADSYKKSLDKVLATARAIGNDPKAMGGLLLQQGAAKLKVFTEGFKAFREEGVSAGQAIQAQMNTINVESVLGLSDMKGAQQGVIAAYGNVNAVSKETLSNIGSMAFEFGIAGTEAAALNASLSQIPGETSASAADAMEMTGHLAEMQGIAPGKIMKDMAKNTGEMARAGGKGAEEFGKSVIALHKMGVEMSTASKIADGLLDFESSINSQMEASVLLGREINLDKARELALNNDLEGMTKEIANNIGGAAEFGKMNRLEQDALAKSVGMSTEELAKMMDAQEESNKYFGEGAGLAMNALGHMVEVGSGAAGFFKENGLLLLASLQFLTMGNGLQLIGNGLLIAKNVIIAVGNGLLMAGSFVMNLITGGVAGQIAKFIVLNTVKAAGHVADKAHAVWTRMTENTQFGLFMANIAKRRAARLAEATAGAGGSAASGAGAAAGGAAKVGAGGAAAGKGLKGIASGVGAFGSGKVILGALIGLPASAIGLVAMVAGIPALAAASMLGVPAGKGLKGIANGVGAFGDGKVAMGALVVGLTGIGLGVMVAGVPALIVAAILGIPAGIGLKGIASGVKAFGSGKVAMGALLIAAVAGGMLLLGAAAMLFAAGGAAGTAMMIISLIALVAAIAVLGALGMGGVGFVGVALVLALGVAMLLLGAAVMLAGIGISMVVDAFTRMFAVVSMENIAALLMLGPALTLIAVGMVLFAVSLLIAAPAMLIFGIAAFFASFGVAALGAAFMLLGAGLMIASVGLLLMNVAVQQLAENVPLVSGHLVTMASSAAGLLLVAGAVWAISAGLGMMALAGLAVLPIIGGLIMLAAVAPALVALGGALGDLLGGGGGDEKDDKMDELIGEIRGLKAIMSQGGVINMDGKKVGDVLRLGMSSSGVK